jgi:hypothetical protein
MAKKSYSRSVDKDYEDFGIDNILVAHDLFEEKLGKPHIFKIELDDGTNEPVTRDELVRKSQESRRRGLNIEGLELLMIRSTQNGGDQALSLDVRWRENNTNARFHIYAKNVPESKINWAKAMYTDISKLSESWSSGTSTIEEKSEHKKSQKTNLSDINVNVTGNNNSVNAGSNSSQRGYINGHSKLEVASWIAGIIAAIIAVLLYINNH